MKVINECKFFIGNQSSPLVMAFSLFKPLLAEAPEGRFYIGCDAYYDGFHWMSHNSTSDFSKLNTYINY